ncbi:FecR family protein [Sphingomonas sp. CLY1604]|uniref:FecR family protein n=1 Tax=Sphingomonas sp. CLY1604 TaxID=3457786 RepID=UPI003FD8235E
MRLVRNDALAASNRDEQAALWCLELSDGILSADQRNAFEQWYADAENAAAFQHAAAAWDTVEAIANTPEVVQMRSEALDTFRRVNLRRWRAPQARLLLKWVGGLGTVAAVVAGMLAFVTMPEHDVFRTAVGERRVTMLEDGSRLSLDADSEVEAMLDGKQRALTLAQGRAKFDVAHNPLRPFTVTVGDTLVVATGTSFSVEKLGGEIHVILFEGRVAILDKAGVPVKTATGGAADAELAPGHELTVPFAGGTAAHVASTGTRDALVWQQGQVSFDDAPLGLAVERMNRYLSEPLVVGDARAAQVRVTGVYDGTDAAGFLEALRQLNGVRAERRTGKVLLTRG